MTTADPNLHPLSKRRSKIIVYYLVSSAVLLLLGFFFWLIVWRHIAYTDDAYVEGNQVLITPLHNGFITAIHTDDSFLVKKGQLLVELDQTDAHIAFHLAEKNLAQVVRQVCQMFHEAFAYKSDLSVKKAETIKAIQDYEHRKGVIAAGGVSAEDFEHALAALRANFYSLKMTKALYDESVAIIQDTSIKDHPLVLQSVQKLKDAWVQLYRCNIYSPVDGLASQRTIQVGMQVHAGTPLLSVIPMDQIWVNANFKETQMRHMRIGQKATITADLYGHGVKFHGKIVGLPGAAGNTLSLLPPQNLSGNWIKIVQRLPVRIELDKEELNKHPLRLGLSMKTFVNLRDQSGLFLPTSTQGSPTYQTSIFEEEELGVHDVINSTIYENLDPTLEDYLDNPIAFPFLDISLPPIAEEALIEDEELSIITPKLPAS